MQKYDWRIAGAPLLLIISLYGLYSHIVERRHRNEIILHGSEAQASIVASPGPEAVAIEWLDTSGLKRAGRAWTGKPFAREARNGQRVAIKYDANLALEPVILSEVSERERVNAYWIYANIGAALAATMFCTLIGIFILFGMRRRSQSQNGLHSP